MNELKNLLIWLAGFDPEICQVVASRNDTFRIHILPDRLGWHWLEFTNDQLSLRDTAILQFAIQQAIAARGWYFDVAYLPLRQSDDKYHADVQVTKSLEGVDADLRSAKSDNPAEALLAAYVKALEAQA